MSLVRRFKTFCAGVAAAGAIACSGGPPAGDHDSSNLVQNANFSLRDGTGVPTGFEYAPNDCVRLRVESNVLRLDKIADGDFPQSLPALPLPVEEGAEYEFRIDMRTERFFTWVFSEVEIQDAAGRSLGWFGSERKLSGNTPWTVLTGRFRTPPGATRAYWMLARSYDFLGGSIWLRNPSFEKK